MAMRPRPRSAPSLQRHGERKRKGARGRAGRQRARVHHAEREGRNEDRGGGGQRRKEDGRVSLDRSVPLLSPSCDLVMCCAPFNSVSASRGDLRRPRWTRKMRCRRRGDAAEPPIDAALRGESNAVSVSVHGALAKAAESLQVHVPGSCGRRDSGENFFLPRNFAIRHVIKT